MSAAGLETDGPDRSTPTSRDLPSLMPSTSSITLTFMDVFYRVKTEDETHRVSIRRVLGHGSTTSPSSTAQIRERTILNGITGTASPGEILAVLGPSGSGKSTLLNAIAGRLQIRGGFSGTILANDRKLSRSVLRRTGFVTQDDVLYPHLTVRETLIFCALLRLPPSLARSEKIAAADSVVAELGLGKCRDTMIGNGFVRGVSGGERKRVSIGHEMIVKPSLLILDEPTSGLDSTAAHRLVGTLAALAQRGKTIVTSMHQPSSRVYQMFESVLLLSEGRCLYFGKGSNAVSYFESVGFSPSFPMNPADFLLDLANGVCHMDGVSERDRPNVKQTLISSYNKSLAPRVKAACQNSSTNNLNDHYSYINEHKKNRNRTTLSSWCNQLTILLQRSLRERRHESFNALRVFQVLAASIISGLMWFHSDYHDIQDRLGLLFFVSIFWGVFPSFNSVFAFPQDRAIFVKERASGMYTLSSYFVARIAGDWPMDLILPTVFLSVAYWMTGLKPDVTSFLQTLAILLGYVLVSQGLGLALGAVIMDAKQASTAVTVTMLAFVLTGGFYVYKVPGCMGWMKYVSTTFYGYKLLIYAQYGDGTEVASVLGCFHGGGVGGGVVDVSCKFIEDDVMGQISPVTSVAVLLFMFLGYRLLAYLALRRIKT